MKGDEILKRKSTLRAHETLRTESSRTRRTSPMYDLNENSEKLKSESKENP